MYLIRVMSTMPPIALLVLFANVFTLVGLPPTPCGLALFLATALRLWDSVILAALAAGTHFGYFLFDPLADFLPHLLKPPPFFFGAYVDPFLFEPLF